MKLRAGDWIEVKSKEEILGTLDKKGQLEGMPFMPQMFRYCGQRFKVYKRAHKTCDTIFPVRGRRVSDSVHLELRCNGEAYGGCQAGCLLFWKEKWLTPIEGQDRRFESVQRDEPIVVARPTNEACCSEDDVWAGTQTSDLAGSDGPRYICQATELPYFTTHLPWWDLRQYIEDYTSGNVTFSQVMQGFVYANYYSLVESGIGLGRVLRWLYDRFQSLWGGLPYPRKNGVLPVNQPTPTCTLNLQSGELVKVKSYQTILETLNTECKNRGLYFDAEMVPYCGGTYRVKDRLLKFLDEKTGKLVTLKTPALILDGVSCQARYSPCRMFCPRGIYSWWREIWLERVSENPQPVPEMRAEQSSVKQ